MNRLSASLIAAVFAVGLASSAPALAETGQTQVAPTTQMPAGATRAERRAIREARRAERRATRRAARAANRPACVAEGRQAGLRGRVLRAHVFVCVRTAQ